MSERITEADIEAARKAGACGKAIEWLLAEPRTVADLVARSREWAEWAARYVPLRESIAVELQAAGFGRSWWRGGERHRDDGPAIEWSNGWRVWFRNGNLHRDDGPAIEGRDGTREWWQYGKLHRDDGPAIEWSNGWREWWRDGVYQPEVGEK